MGVNSPPIVMSHYDPINGVSSYGDGDIPSPMDLGALGELFLASAQPEAPFQSSATPPATTADQLVSLAQSPLPLNYLGVENSATTVPSQQVIPASGGMLAGMGALLAPQECEPGDLPSHQMARSVIQRNGDSGEVAVESLLSPSEVNLADLWLRSGQSDWLNLDQLPNGHPRKISRYRGLRPALTTTKPHSDLEHKKHTSGDLAVGGLLQLLAKTLKNRPKTYVTGLRGELLEADDEQLLGNTDVMVLPYSPALPFAVREKTKAEQAKKEKEEREKARLRRWRDQKPKKDGQGAADSEEVLPDDDEMPQMSNYLNFDVFDFFDRLLSKNAPGERTDQKVGSDGEVKGTNP